MSKVGCDKWAKWGVTNGGKLGEGDFACTSPPSRVLPKGTGQGVGRGRGGGKGGVG